jgi:peptide/nickel transport system permease protein
MALSTGKFVLGRVLSAVPTAVAPVFSLTGVTMPIVVTNLVLIEQVFSVPGVFTGMKRGIAAGDFDLLFGLTAVAAGLVAVSTLVTELVLAWLDPRVRSRA